MFSYPGVHAKFNVAFEALGTINYRRDFDTGESPDR